MRCSEKAGSRTRSAFPGSYRRLLSRAEEFDLLMPSHNEPAVPKVKLQEALAAIEAVLAGQREGRAFTDLWGERVCEYSFDAFSFTLPQWGRAREQAAALLGGDDQKVSDPLRRLLLQRRDGVRVGIEGDADGRTLSTECLKLGSSAGKLPGCQWRPWYGIDAG